jgi:hypothetical protein
MWPDIAEPQHTGAIGHNGHKIAFVRMGKDLLGMLRNVTTRGGHARGVPEGKIVQPPDGTLGGDFEFPAILWMEA